MKNALFATTALVAAGLAGAASANEGFTTSVGGYMNIGAGFYDEGDQSGAVVIREGEIHFNFKAVADNGLTFAGRVELEAATAGDQIDENYASVAGSFGKIEIGGNDEARTRMGTGLLYGPSAWGGYFDQKNLVSSGYNAVNDTDSLGIYYFTPSFSGFQAAVSYQPEAGIDGSGDTNVAFDTDIGGFGKDAWSFGANYTGDFEGFSVSLGGGYTIKDDNGTGLDADIWSVGGTVGASGFTLALYYQDNADSATGTDNGASVAVGASYETGPWTVGAGGSFFTDADYDGYFLGGWVSYKLAPGVTAAAIIEHGDFDPAGSANDTDGTAGAVLLALSF